MAYIGKSPDGTGVRSRFYYTQSSGGGTSVSGSSDDGTSLAFSDGAYVDVYLNGVLLVAGTDYNTTTANTIAGLAALANGDVVEVVVYDIFTVADTVSSLNGGTFAGPITVSGAFTSPGIDDNADATAITIDSSEKVGIGETSPLGTLHVRTSDASITSVNGNADDLILENNGNTGMSICSSTSGEGNINFIDSGDTNIGRIQYTHSDNKMVFRVNDSERMRIASDGTIFVNHSVTQYGSYVGNINVSSGGLTTGFGTSNGEFRNIYSSNSGGSIILKFDSGSNVASLSTGGAWTDASDASYKRDIEDLSYGISTVKALQPRLYHLVANENDDDPQIGFVAQEIETHVPEVVVSDEDKHGSIKKGVSYGRMTAVLTKALQEAIAKIETLETKVAALEAES